MNDNNIDQFRAEIRRRLRESKNEFGDEIIIHYSKFNEDLEHQLEELASNGDLNPKIYDLCIQIGSLGYMQGAKHCLIMSANRINKIQKDFEEIRNKNVDATDNNADDTNKVAEALYTINHDLSNVPKILSVIGLFLIGIWITLFFIMLKL